MADFWIKVEKSTPDKPEIFEIAQELNIDPDAVLGKLIRAWAWLDSNSENGHIKSVTNVLIDRVTGVTGFSDAMKKSGWLEDGEVPNFGRHMGESAKKRAKDSERKRKSRNVTPKSLECPQKSVTESGLDKIRVDKDKDKDSDSKPSVPGCPHFKIIELYNNILPELTKVMPGLWKGKRAVALSARWKEHEAHRDLRFWEWYFTALRNDNQFSFNCGNNDRGWRADLEYFLRGPVFTKNVERFGQ